MYLWHKLTELCYASFKNCNHVPHSIFITYQVCTVIYQGRKYFDCVTFREDWANETSLTPPHFNEVPVLGVSILPLSMIFLGLWNFCCFHFIRTFHQNLKYN